MEEAEVEISSYFNSGNVPQLPGLPVLYSGPCCLPGPRLCFQSSTSGKLGLHPWGLRLLLAVSGATFWASLCSWSSMFHLILPCGQVEPRAPPVIQCSDCPVFLSNHTFLKIPFNNLFRACYSLTYWAFLNFVFLISDCISEQLVHKCVP